MAADCSGCVFTMFVCSQLCVCTLDGLRAQVPSMGHQTWSYVVCHKEDSDMSPSPAFLPLTTISRPPGINSPNSTHLLLITLSAVPHCHGLFIHHTPAALSGELIVFVCKLRMQALSVAVFVSLSGFGLSCFSDPVWSDSVSVFGLFLLFVY